MTTEERNNRLRLGLLATIDGKEYGCSGTRPDKLRPSPWTLTQLNGDRVMGVSFESTWLHLDTPNPSKVLAFHTVLRKNRVWLWTVAYGGGLWHDAVWAGGGGGVVGFSEMYAACCCCSGA